MRIRVRVKPGSSRNRVGGRYPGQHGDELIVSVTARAVDGQANAAVVERLAAALGCPRREIEIVSGATGRSKVVEIPDACAALASALLSQS